VSHDKAVRLIEVTIDTNYPTRLKCWKYKANKIQKGQYIQSLEYLPLENTYQSIIIQRCLKHKYLTRF